MNRIVILRYHRISNPKTERDRDLNYCCPKTLFQKHLGYLHSTQFDIVSLKAIKQAIDEGVNFNRDTIAITFDEGVRDNYVNALPLLEQYNIPATIFVSIGLVKHAIDGAKSRFLKREILTGDDLRVMQDRGVTFGVHNINHSWFPALSFSEAKQEVTKAKKWLENRLETEVGYFSYRKDLYDNEIKRVIKEVGFTLACSTSWGFNYQTSDSYALRRIEINGTDPVWKLSQKLKFGINDASVLVPIKYYSKRFRDRFTK